MAETVAIAYTVTVAVEVDPAGIPDCDGNCRYYSGAEIHPGDCRPVVVNVRVWDEGIERADPPHDLDGNDAYSTGTPGGPAALAALYDLADTATWPAWVIG